MYYKYIWVFLLATKQAGQSDIYIKDSKSSPTQNEIFKSAASSGTVTNDMQVSLGHIFLSRYLTLGNLTLTLQTSITTAICAAALTYYY